MRIPQSSVKGKLILLNFKAQLLAIYSADRLVLLQVNYFLIHSMFQKFARLNFIKDLQEPQFMDDIKNITHFNFILVATRYYLFFCKQCEKDDLWSILSSMNLALTT